MDDLDKRGLAGAIAGVALGRLIRSFGENHIEALAELDWLEGPARGGDRADHEALTTRPSSTRMRPMEKRKLRPRQNWSKERTPAVSRAAAQSALTVWGCARRESKKAPWFRRDRSGCKCLVGRIIARRCRRAQSSEPLLQPQPTAPCFGGQNLQRSGQGDPQRRHLDHHRARRSALHSARQERQQRAERNAGLGGLRPSARQWGRSALPP